MQITRLIPALASIPFNGLNERGRPVGSFPLAGLFASGDSRAAIPVKLERLDLIFSNTSVLQSPTIWHVSTFSQILLIERIERTEIIRVFNSR